MYRVKYPLCSNNNIIAIVLLLTFTFFSCKNESESTVTASNSQHIIDSLKLSASDVAILKNSSIATKAGRILYISYYYNYPKSDNFIDADIEIINEIANHSNYKIKSIDFTGSNAVDSSFIISRWQDYESMLYKKVAQFEKLGISNVLFIPKFNRLFVETKKNETYLLLLSDNKVLIQNFDSIYVKIDSNLYLSKK